MCTLFYLHVSLYWNFEVDYAGVICDLYREHGLVWAAERVKKKFMQNKQHKSILKYETDQP